MKNTNTYNKTSSIIIFRSYKEQIEELIKLELIKKEDGYDWYHGILTYSFDGTDPKFEHPQLKILWIGVKNTVDNSKLRREASIKNGSKGGRPKSSTSESEEEIVNTELVSEHEEHSNDNLSVKDLLDYHKRECPITLKDTKRFLIDAMITQRSITTIKQLQEKYTSI